MSSFVPVKLHFEADLMIAKGCFDPLTLTKLLQGSLTDQLYRSAVQTYLVGMTKTTLTSKGKSWKN